MKNEAEVCNDVYNKYIISGVSVDLNEVHYVNEFIKKNKKKLLYPSCKFILVEDDFCFSTLKIISGQYNKKLILNNNCFFCKFAIIGINNIFFFIYYLRRFFEY